MTPTVIEYLSQVSNFIGFYLDKLKMSSPLLFTLVKLIMGGLLILFSVDKININPEVDLYVVSMLTLLTSYVSPRTTQAKNNYNDKQLELHGSDSNIDRTNGVESDNETEPVQEL